MSEKTNPDIKIFVSNRIDLASETINEAPYVNVRCGAVFDSNTDHKMLGDNTGDNISEKRMSFCELTVQYWAWKNIDADYYGLCHYRRYLSFDSQLHEVAVSEHDNGCVNIDYLTDNVRDKYKLNYDGVKDMLDKYDVIACAPIDYDKTNLEAMKNSPDYHNMDDVYEAIKIIHEKYPDMDEIVSEYMNSKKIRLYNCWVMRKDIFLQYSQWLFSILFELEKRIDMSKYGIQKYRTPGTIGERLFGIYCLYLSKQKEVRFKDQQLLFIEHPEEINSLKPYWGENQITIASNFNNNYVHTFSVSLLSFLNCINTKNKYEIIILSEDITSDNQKVLSDMIVNYDNVHLTFYNPFPILSGVKLFVDNSVYSKDLYVRVIIPFVLHNYNKTLVIDADTIIKKDLADLYNIPMNNYLMAAVRDVVYGGYLNGVVPGTMDYTQNVLKLNDPYDYCNTGVIVLDCERIRQTYHLDDILFKINKQRYRIYEQDMLNVLFNGKILFLNPRWNLFTYTNPSIKQCVEMAPLNEYNDYQEARKEPYIIHFAAHPKPWCTTNGDYSTEFWKFARLSPYYEEILGQFSWNISNGLYEYRKHNKSHIESFRKIADKFLPKGSRRREFVKKIYYGIVKH
ncbi:DUF4422 domain-containing protein [Megasphaera sp.]|uniref:DUF4422 domain-containing protein n=1 Tax=Megasphaera sp. TaxID=2023260 RepID=UPI00266DC2FB|nr:DUF4422 domain-containing protein [uncultured Megasphaera sp.]